MGGQGGSYADCIPIRVSCLRECRWRSCYCGGLTLGSDCVHLYPTNLKRSLLGCIVLSSRNTSVEYHHCQGCEEAPIPGEGIKKKNTSIFARFHVFQKPGAGILGCIVTRLSPRRCTGKHTSTVVMNKRNNTLLGGGEQYFFTFRKRRVGLQRYLFR